MLLLIVDEIVLKMETMIIICIMANSKVSDDPNKELKTLN